MPQLAHCWRTIELRGKIRGYARLVDQMFLRRMRTSGGMAHVRPVGHAAFFFKGDWIIEVVSGVYRAVAV
jgi:hypothetical protein